MTYPVPGSVRWHHRRYEYLKKQRQEYIPHWRELAEYILPRRGSFLKTRRKGGNINGSIIDSTATWALRVLVAGIMTGVVSPARRWFEFTTPDPEMRRFGAIGEWIDLLEKRVYRRFRQSNFYRATPDFLEEECLFGTAATHVRRVSEDRGGLAWQALTAGQFCIANDEQGRATTLYETAALTLEQLVGLYVRKKEDYGLLSEGTRGLIEQGNWDAEVRVVSCCYPNRSFVYGSADSREFPYRHVVFEANEGGRDDAKFLHEGGFKSFPYHAARWWLKGGEVYGRSPAMDVLGDVKQLQDQHEKKGVALSVQVQPPMLADAELENTRVSTLPGDVTFVSGLNQSAHAGMRPAFEVSPRLADFVMDMEDVRARIRRGLYSDLFLAIIDRPGVQPLNDSEVFERKEEKLVALGPIMERLDDEFLEPAIDAAAEYETEYMPPSPKELQGVKLEVEYLNVIAIAQRAAGLDGMRESFGFAASLAQAQAGAGMPPGALDILDTDAAVREFAEKRGMEASIVRDEEAVERIRAARAEQQQKQAEMARAEQAAKAAQGFAGAAASASQVGPQEQPI